MRERGTWRGVRAEPIRGIARRGPATVAALVLVLTPAPWLTRLQAASLVPTSTAVISAPNPSTYGESATFTATVSTAAGTPTGTIQFFDGGAPLGTVGLSGGSAQLTTSFLPQGSHTITASYSGDGNYAASTSPPLTHTVNPGTRGPTSTSILSSLNPAGPRETVTFTVTVFSPLPGTPGGTVSLMDSTQVLDSATLVDRVAEFTVGPLSPGSHPITAVYGGDAVYAGSTSPVLLQVVTAPEQFPSSATVVSSPNPSEVGQPVTLKVFVTGGGGQPTGGVLFFDSGKTIGYVELVSGTGSIVVSDFAAGGHSITARYGGDARFAGCTSPDLLQVVRTPALTASTTALASSANPSVLGQTVTFTATVTSNSGTPTGRVQFRDGASLMGTASLTDVGRASLSAANLASGDHVITAVYEGDSGHLGSTSAALRQAVNLPPRAATSTTLVSSTSQSAAGQPVTFTATVTSNSGAPTGSVQFFDGSLLLGTASLSGGKAQVSTSSLPVGSRYITAIYSGDNTYAGSSSAPLPHTVLLGDSRPILKSSPNPSVRGQPVTFEVQTDPSCEGTVTFMDGAAWAGTALPEQGGRYRVTLALIAVGVHKMVAIYSGGAVCPASTSGTLEHVVRPADTATSISAAAAPSGVSSVLVLTAKTQVLPPGTGTPSGEVAFRDGDTVLGRSNLSAAGAATLTVNLNASTPHALNAQYLGNAEFTGSASARLTDLAALAKPDFEAAYVVNSASFAPGLSPNAFATIFGSRLSGGATAASGLPYPTMAQGVRVLMNGRAVQVAYVSDTQINFVVPSDMPVGTASLVVSTPLGTSKTIDVPVLAASPGIFADAVTGFGAVLIAGTAETTLTRPVQAGEYIEVYCTGLGAADASYRTALPVVVSLGALRLTPTYSGLNPVFPGLYQVNLQIPHGVSGQQTLSIEINGRRSNEVKIRAQ